MGKILPSYKLSVIKEITDNITSNSSHYYLYASNPIASQQLVEVANNDLDIYFNTIWYMMFGKKITSKDIYPVIVKNIWSTNTTYSMYDQTSNTLHSNNNFYVISEPSEIGGVYNIYKCIDNANNAKSIYDPGSIGTPTQITTFQTADNYKWKYITTVSASVWDRFNTGEYVPIYANNLLQASAQTYSGVEVVMISNGGINYEAYTNGVVQSISNSTLIVLANTASSDNFKYNNNSIYLYSLSTGTSQLKTISNYIANVSGKWVYLNEPANTDIIVAGETLYKISPSVIFNTDGDNHPVAYSVVNTSTNSIFSIVILDAGNNISRANVSINSTYGSGANLYCIVPPPGGHGAEPARELNVEGMCISVNFSNNESNTITTSNTIYNKIGIIKNPYQMYANTDKGSRYSNTTFNQLLKANVGMVHSFSVGDTVIGKTSGAKGVVALANATVIYLTGDKFFSNNEYIGNSSVSNVTTITINSLGNLFPNDLTPLYVQNINNIYRNDTTTESFKIIIKI